MKLFGRDKANDQVKAMGEARSAGAACAHPVTPRIVLREDAAMPARVTGVKCAQCGQMVSYTGNVEGLIKKN